MVLFNQFKGFWKVGLECVECVITVFPQIFTVLPQKNSKYESVAASTVILSLMFPESKLFIILKPGFNKHLEPSKGHSWTHFFNLRSETNSRVQSWQFDVNLASNSEPDSGETFEWGEAWEAELLVNCWSDFWIALTLWIVLQSSTLHDNYTK